MLNSAKEKAAGELCVRRYEGLTLVDRWRDWQWQEGRQSLGTR